MSIASFYLIVFPEIPAIEAKFRNSNLCIPAQFKWALVGKNSAFYFDLGKAGF